MNEQTNKQTEEVLLVLPQNPALSEDKMFVFGLPA
jgi:hypothetical protein